MQDSPFCVIITVKTDAGGLKAAIYCKEVVMFYKDFKERNLSALGLGCMRLPVLDEDPGKIDQETVDKMVTYALDHGINYFDTAWMYHKGNSEIAIGKALAKHPRESFYLSSKFPGYDSANMSSAKEIFEKQLEKCGVDYFDFYLMHNINENNQAFYLEDKEVWEYFASEVKAGRIKHLGFSCHGQHDLLKKVLDKYGDILEFCQIQLNWLDWKLQNAKAKVEMIESCGLPVWVMEPVRGGRLAKLDEKYEAKLKELKPEASMPEWCFRFLQGIPSVTMTLSGMSNMDQLVENIKIYEECKPLSEAETEVLLGIADEMLKEKTLPCTVCRYCTTYCPMQIDIPKMIAVYNECVYNGSGFAAKRVLDHEPEGHRPEDCIGCGACQQACPQMINIPQMMQDLNAIYQEALKAPAN